MNETSTLNELIKKIPLNLKIFLNLRVRLVAIRFTMSRTHTSQALIPSQEKSPKLVKNICFTSTLTVKSIYIYKNNLRNN